MTISTWSLSGWWQQNLRGTLSSSTLLSGRGAGEGAERGTDRADTVIMLTAVSVKLTAAPHIMQERKRAPQAFIIATLILYPVVALSASLALGPAPLQTAPPLLSKLTCKSPPTISQTPPILSQYQPIACVHWLNTQIALELLNCGQVYFQMLFPFRPTIRTRRLSQVWLRPCLKRWGWLSSLCWSTPSAGLLSLLFSYGQPGTPTHQTKVRPKQTHECMSCTVTQ